MNESQPRNPREKEDRRQMALDLLGPAADPIAAVSIVAAPSIPKAVRKKAAGKSQSETPVKPVRGTTERSGTKSARSADSALPAEKAPAPRTKKPPERTRRTAQEMASRQREISVSEFFSKNRHLLGFDNPAKALLTTIKEGVDNALDACEEAGILPDILVEVIPEGEDRFRVVIEDHGPGIMRAQVPRIFGSLLYGSKFHVLKQSRGQQGIGISAAGMYGMLTTGQPIRIISRTGRRKPAHLFELAMDTRKNEPKILRDEEVEWEHDHGTRVEITLQGTYKRGRHSVDGYLRQVAIANPHARILYRPPDKSAEKTEEEEDQGVIDSLNAPVDGLQLFERVTDELPPEPKEIQPHPHGVELGRFLEMLQNTKARTASLFLQSEFSRVSSKVATEILELARVKETARPSAVSRAHAEQLHRAMAEVKIMAPPANCISPIGEDLLLRALEEEVEAAFHATVTRPPAVYRGNPFQVEVGLSYGGGLAADDLITLYRYANRVPLQYQQGACAITKGVMSIDWKKYHLSQSKGALPTGPMVLVVHIASVWVPFTSESKEAVAHYPEIIKEIRLGLMEAGRRLGIHIRRQRRDLDEHKKRSYIQKYIPHIGAALQDILDLSDPERDTTIATLTDVLEKARDAK